MLAFRGVKIFMGSLKMRRVYPSLIFLITAFQVFTGQAEASEDTLDVSGNAVVFFGPSQAEYVAMSDNEKDKIDETLYDFYHYRRKVLPFLGLNHIQEFFTSRLKIRVQLDGPESIIYYRRGFDQVVGLIMTDGHYEPVIFLGAASDTRLISMFKEFFGLE